MSPSTRSTLIRSVSLAVAFVLALVTAPASAQQIKFEDQDRATPVKVVEHVCFPGFPPCNGPCIWSPSDHSVDFTVDARPSAILTKVEWRVFDQYGNQVSSGNGAISADGKHASGTASPAPGAWLTTQCNTFVVYHYRVNAEMKYTDTGLGGRSWRTFTVRLVCKTCIGNPPIHPDTNGPHRIDWRFTAQDFTTQWIALNTTEFTQPVTVSFTSSVPWLIVDPPQWDIIVEPNQSVSMQVPVIVLPDALPGATAALIMTVTPLLQPELATSVTTKVVIINPGTGSCLPTQGDCFEEHAGGSCNNPYCCEVVCGLDPFCCSQNWDDLCVQLAQTTCAPPAD